MAKYCPAINEKVLYPVCMECDEKLCEKLHPSNKFNAEKVTEDIIQWIKDWFNNNGPDCNAIVGISGGKDSSIVAALCVKALGNDRVFGVLMPNGTQSDISDAYKLVEHLNISYEEINIEQSVKSLSAFIPNMSQQAKINLPPRIRMATLYAVSQSHNGRVANTCNLSEDFIGYSTRWGDNVGDFAPIADLTVTELKEIGKVLGLPIELVDKIPSDGLCGKTDEDNFGFSYKVLDTYIRTGICYDNNIKEKIDEKHYKNLFKLVPLPKFHYCI